MVCSVTVCSARRLRHQSQSAQLQRLLALTSSQLLTLALVNAGVGEVDGADVGEEIGALVVGT